MKYETVRDVTLPKIGFGTAFLGGNRIANRSAGDYYLSAMKAALELGYTHIDTAESYAGGFAEELIGHAMREMQIKRESLFLTSKVLPTPWSYSKVMRACEGSLSRLGTEYLDLYLIHWPNPLASMKETFRALNQLVRDGKVKHLGVSNFSLNQLRNAQTLSETPILTNQVPYNIVARWIASSGVLEYCQQNDVFLTAYMPLKLYNRKIRTNQIIQSVAQAHGVTSFQIALAWLVAQARVITIPMSFDPKHQKENFDAADLELTPSELDQLNGLT